jgi:diguanylate cyclase (GGDEF)-like protein
LLSYKLQGAPCWCEIADGTTLGARPEEQAADRLLIISHDIPSHSGEALGAIYAGIDPRSKFRSAGPEALSNSAQLAALAIETGGLYSDLVHRSEFDLLTDIHNRFSLEKRLDTLITGARRQDEIFGLIYIDLDEFKQVNDRHGHGVGDLYLQEAALRMKNQLRPEDMLARLGGDEFAAVVSAVRSRTDVKEITRRLEACFDEVFVLDGCRIPGSASVGIAVYPQDGTTRDALLSTADAAMYEAKHQRHETAAPCAGKET